MSIAIEKAEALGHMIQAMIFTPEEREAFHKIIMDFNALYYKMDKQTWLSTKYRDVFIMKAPTDLWIYQELISHLKPDAIIECGTCRGGSALFMRDMLNLNGLQDSLMITIDIDPSKRNPKSEEPGIDFIEGSSTDSDIVQLVRGKIQGRERVMAILDSDHETEHVYQEAEIYGEMVSVGMPLIIEDTSNSPAKEACDRFVLHHSKEFKPDHWCEKYMLTFCRGGFLEKVKVEE